MSIATVSALLLVFAQVGAFSDDDSGNAPQDIALAVVENGDKPSELHAEIAQLIADWGKLADESQVTEALSKRLRTLRATLAPKGTPNTERRRQASEATALLVWPFLAQTIPQPIAQTFADVTQPEAGIRGSDRMAKEGHSTEPLGWDVQTTHALALARAGKTDDAIAEVDLLITKVSINEKVGRLPDLTLTFLGTTRSQKSVLKQIYLVKAAILAMAGKSVESVKSSSQAGRVEVSKPTEEDQAAIQTMLHMVILNVDGLKPRINNVRVPQGSVLFQIPVPYPTGLSFSPDNRLLAITAREKVILWSLENKKQVDEFVTTGKAHAPVFTPDSTSVVVADAVGNLEYMSTLRSWNLKTRKQTQLGECAGYVSDLQYNSAGSRLAAATTYGPIGVSTLRKPDSPWHGGQLLTWDPRNSKPPLTIDCPLTELPKNTKISDTDVLMNAIAKSVPRYIALNEDGSKLAAVTESGRITVYDLSNGQPLFIAQGDGRPRFMETAPYRLSCGGRLFDEQGLVVQGENEPPVKWKARAGHFGVTTIRSGQIHLLDFTQPSQDRFIAAPATTNPLLGVTSNGRFVAVGESDSVRVWDLGDEAIVDGTANEH